jgi:hypothetical protein
MASTRAYQPCKEEAEEEEDGTTKNMIFLNLRGTFSVSCTNSQLMRMIIPHVIMAKKIPQHAAAIQTGTFELIKITPQMITNALCTK